MTAIKNANALECVTLKRTMGKYVFPLFIPGLMLLCYINYEMKITVDFTSSSNVVVGDPVSGNTLDRSLRLSPAKSLRDDGKEENVTK